jgi:hypothetical protein
MTGRFTLLALLIAVPGWSQTIELTPLVGYATAAGIEQRTSGVEHLEIRRGLTWGGQATWFVAPRIGVEALWTYQSSSVSMSTATGSATLFSTTANAVHGGLVYRLGGDHTVVRPFVAGGVGATVLSAPELEHETKASWYAGGGLTWFATARVGVKLLARYRPTMLSEASSGICDPFGFCQRALRSFEFSGGAAFRF